MPTTVPTRTGRARARDGVARAQRIRELGQSLAEFALTFPMVMLMVLFGLDFGRVFLGWVALNSAAREAANYAAMNPDAWTLPYNLAVQAEYSRLVTTEASGINCTLTTPIAAPTFASGTTVGAPAEVRLTCSFRLITPFIGMLVGNPIPVSASSAFPIRSGLIEGIPTETATPTPAPPTPTPTPDPGATPTPTPTPAPTPTPTPTPAGCTVPSLLNLQTNKAQEAWYAAGFTGQVIFSPLVPPNYRIQWQSMTVGQYPVDCSSGITVRSSAP